MATDSGWRADPFGLHEERFFNSNDVRTTLVRDGSRGGITGGAKRFGRRCVYRKHNVECSHELSKMWGL